MRRLVYSGYELIRKAYEGVGVYEAVSNRVVNREGYKGIGVYMNVLGQVLAALKKKPTHTNFPTPNPHCIHPHSSTTLSYMALAICGVGVLSYALLYTPPIITVSGALSEIIALALYLTITPPPTLPLLILQYSQLREYVLLYCPLFIRVVVHTYFNKLTICISNIYNVAMLHSIDIRALYESVHTIMSVYTMGRGCGTWVWCRGGPSDKEVWGFQNSGNKNPKLVLWPRGVNFRVYDLQHIHLILDFFYFIFFFLGYNSLRREK